MTASCRDQLENMEQLLKWHCQTKMGIAALAGVVVGAVLGVLLS